MVELVTVPPVAQELADLFGAAGHRLYLVGGTVRDALLGRPETDLDFTTDARPDAVLALVDGWASAVWDTGIAFGTVGLRRRGVTMEITTFRSDAYDRVSRNPVVEKAMWSMTPARSFGNRPPETCRMGRPPA